MAWDIRHFRAFIAVAEELNFHRAAERLNLAQPSVTRMIRWIEDELGVGLFERTTRAVRLTSEGALFLEECRAAVARFDTALRQSRALASGAVGELGVGVSDFSILGVLPGLIRSFRREHPQIALQLFDLERDDQFARIETGALDIGFTLGPVGMPALDSLPLGREPLVALLGSEHRLARRSSLRLTDLAGEPFVLGSRRGWAAYRTLLDRVFAAAGFVPQIGQEVFQSIEVFGLVAAGLGVSIYPACARRVHNRGLVVRRLQDVDAQLDMVAAWRRDRRSGALAHMIDFLQRTASPQASRTDGRN